MTATKMKSLNGSLLLKDTSKRQGPLITRGLICSKLTNLTDNSNTTN